MTSLEKTILCAAKYIQCSQTCLGCRCIDCEKGEDLRKYGLCGSCRWEDTERFHPTCKRFIDKKEQTK